MPFIYLSSTLQNHVILFLKVYSSFSFIYELSICCLLKILNFVTPDTNIFSSSVLLVFCCVCVCVCVHMDTHMQSFIQAFLTYSVVIF